ncbi:hypothetical protein [Streptomyces avermitilis]|uniref:hypothetical protein n=1 Tax=Streptomyces avermitilis TaxID=33903 RepID=UPI0033B290CD
MQQCFATVFSACLVRTAHPALTARRTLLARDNAEWFRLPSTVVPPLAPASVSASNCGPLLSDTADEQWALTQAQEQVETDRFRD